MIFIYRIITLLAGFVLEFAFGWPGKLWHPIMGIGKLISCSEKALRRIFPRSDKGQRAAGIIMAAVLPLVSFFVSGAVVYLLYRINLIIGLAVESFMCWTIFASNSLKTAAYEVYNSLENEGIEAGRRAVSMIVGRDTEELSETGVIKATVETVAENLSDGIIAPMIFVLIGGAPFGYLYKTVNTMDSMVGYKNDKYMFFGTGAARLDDFCNYLPARLSGVLMVVCAGICKMDRKSAWRIFKRDRYNHASPNSAQTESVMAGALGVQLAGDAVYFGQLYEKKTIGDAVREIERRDIKDSVRLMLTTCCFSAAVVSIILLTAFAVTAL